MAHNYDLENQYIRNIDTDHIVADGATAGMNHNSNGDFTRNNPTLNLSLSMTPLCCIAYDNTYRMLTFSLRHNINRMLMTYVKTCLPNRNLKSKCIEEDTR